jgi:hypothetical protein
MLLNAILDFSLDGGVRTVYVPTAASIVAAIRKRVVPDLFTRVYDAPARHYSCPRVTQNGVEYWALSLSENADRVVRLVPASPKCADLRTPLICVFHDIEEDVDTAISAVECRRYLTRMLETEKDRGVPATYTVLGRLLTQKRDEIWTSNPRHSIGFHSFDHDLADLSQLTRCREVDLQLRGYRPARSIITPELTDYRLSYLNFEWFASSERSLGSMCCSLQNGIVKIPIATDDYPIHAGRTTYHHWESRLLDLTRERNLVAFGLHDCYAPAWLDAYGDLLDRLGAIGRFVTADAICDRVFWEQGLDMLAAAPVVS